MQVLNILLLKNLSVALSLILSSSQTQQQLSVNELFVVVFLELKVLKKLFIKNLKVT
jgi:hypothetical protein